MKNIITLLFCLYAFTAIQAQVSDEIKAMRLSNLDSAQKANYEQAYLAHQAKTKLKEQSRTLKSASVTTTVSKTVTVTAGGLETALGSYLTTVTNLTVKGTIDARDFKTMRDDMSSLAVVNISAVTIAKYTGTGGTYPYGTSSITYPAKTIPEGAFYFYDELTSITIPSSVTSIGDYAFEYCTGLTSITIPSSVTSIGDCAFECCIGLTSITIPSSVISIGNYAFEACTGLTSITIPSSVISIGDEVFCNCAALITVDEDNEYYSSADGVLFDKEKATLIYCPTSKTGTYTIPSMVTTIGHAAFWHCDELTSIIIPSSIDSIGGAAFCGCSSLTSITIPSSVTSIGYMTFDGCSSLTSISIPSSIKSIRNSAFEDCTGLTSITIPSSVTSIGYGVFFNCAALITVDEDNEYYSSADGVLFDKEKTTLIFCPTSKTGTYTIPSTVTLIEITAFWYCDDLTSITIPTSVTSIESWAFCRCFGITTFTIPSSVTSIGDYAFEYCTGLTSIYACSTTPVDLSSSNNVFYGVDNSACTLYVPAGSKSAYQSADQWSDFNNIVEMSDNTLSVSTNAVSLGYAANSTQSVTITSDTTWLVSSNQSWLSVSPTSGTGNGTLVLTAEANNSEDERTATVTVSADGVVPQTITITQEGETVSYTLSVSATQVSFDYAANSTQSITITSNTIWAASSSQSWLNVSPTSGTGNGTLVLTAEANDSEDEQTATVTVSADGVDSQTITVTQEGKILNENDTIEISLETPDNGCEGSDIDLNYTISSGIPSRYSIEFSSAAISAGFEDIEYTSLSSNISSGTISFSIPSGTEDGTYNASLQMDNGEDIESEQYSFSFTINISSDYLIDKFDDVIICDNSLGRFTSFQWYKDDEIINEATNQYYCDPDGLSGSYYCQVTTEDGDERYTCSKDYTDSEYKSAEIAVYPSTVQRGQSCTINITGFNEKELEEAVLTIYTTSGIKVYYTNDVEESNIIDMDGYTGLLVGKLKVTSKN